MARFNDADEMFTHDQTCLLILGQGAGDRELLQRKRKSGRESREAEHRDHQVKSRTFFC